MASDPVDTSAEAIDLHLCENEAAGPMASYRYADSAGISTRVGWHRKNDATLRALAKERDALHAYWHEAAASRDRHIEAGDAARAAALAAASREQEARAEAGRLRELLGAVIGERLSGESNPNVPNHKTVTVAIAWGDLRAARAALAQEPRHD